MPDTIILKNISKTYKIPSISTMEAFSNYQCLINVSMQMSLTKSYLSSVPNGAGKTTLMKITGLIIPDEGKLTMNNKSIGFVTQNERSFYSETQPHVKIWFFTALCII